MCSAGAHFQRQPGQKLQLHSSTLGLQTAVTQQDISDLGLQHAACYWDVVSASSQHQASEHMCMCSAGVYFQRQPSGQTLQLHPVHQWTGSRLQPPQAHHRCPLCLNSSKSSQALCLPGEQPHTHFHVWVSIPSKGISASQKPARIAVFQQC